MPAVGLLLLAGYFISLPEGIVWPLQQWLRFLLVALCCHFLAAFLPFLRRDDRPGFWQYNKSLFLRAILSGVYAAVLFAGLALALAAVQHLFGLDIKENTYAELGVVLLGVFHTWIFLAGIPRDLEGLNRSDDYPSGLKVFTQFILLPLVSLYFIILITYEAKILVTWNWPEGWVAQLVLWYSVVGILSLLLLHPLQTREGNRWIAAFGRWFFAGLVPLVLMLYFAIYQRIAEYGLTVNRSLVVTMAVGLTLVVLYFVLGRSRDIRAFPIALFFLALVSALGPFSAFALSERSQRARLTEYLTTNGMYEKGKLRAAPGTVSEEDRQEMSSIVDYLLEWHGADAFAGLLDPEFLKGLGRRGTWQEGDSVAFRLGFTYEASWRLVGGRSRFYYTADDELRQPLSLAGWSYLVDYSYAGAHDSLHAYALGNDSCFVEFDSTALAVNLTVGPDRSAESRKNTLDVANCIRELRPGGGGPIDPARMAFPSEADGLRCLWRFEQISGASADGRLHIDSLRARILFGEK